MGDRMQFEAGLAPGTTEKALLALIAAEGRARGGAVELVPAASTPVGSARASVDFGDFRQGTRVQAVIERDGGAARSLRLWTSLSTGDPYLPSERDIMLRLYDLATALYHAVPCEWVRQVNFGQEGQWFWRLQEGADIPRGPLTLDPCAENEAEAFIPLSGARTPFVRRDAGYGPIYVDPPPGLDAAPALLRECPCGNGWNVDPADVDAYHDIPLPLELELRRLAWPHRTREAIERALGPPSAKLGPHRWSEDSLAEGCRFPMHDQWVYWTLHDRVVLTLKFYGEGFVLPGFGRKRRIGA